MTAIKPKILVVEDDPSSLEFMTRLLGKLDFRTDNATTAGEALLKLETDDLPAAVVLDLRLPDANGSLVLRRIRRGPLPVKVAVVTGMTDPHELAELRIRYSPDVIFSKPLDHSKFIDWVYEVTSDAED